MKNYSVAVANEFIKLAMKEGTPISNMKLQKLMYFLQGHALAISGQPIIEETSEAWQYGPVFPRTYHEFKHFGSAPITELAIFPFSETGEPWSVPLPEDRKLIESVWNAYKHFDAVRLSQISHLPDGPWAAAYASGNSRSAEITNEAMRSYFAKTAS